MPCVQPDSISQNGNTTLGDAADGKLWARPPIAERLGKLPRLLLLLCTEKAGGLHLVLIK